MRQELEQALGNCKYQTNCCTCIEKNAYESIAEERFYIYDEENNENPVRLAHAEEPFQLTVNNSNLKNICLVKTDNCLLTDVTGKCDCLLFDDNKLFFVEIKTSRSGTRSKRRKRAIEQLGKTVNLLKTKAIDITSLDSTAVICFKNMEPRIINTANNTAKAEFFELHKVKLEERNYIEF